MGLKDIGATLPPGFRFYPSDEELVCHYLYKKIANEEALKGTLVEVDLHTCEPWQLPEVAKLNADEWYFFSFRDRKYATGFRTNRATVTGYWKATGKDRTVHDPITREIIGMRKTLVFYRNRAPNGIKTGWIMHEFRLETPHIPPKEDWVLCRVFHRSKAENSNEMNHHHHLHDHQSMQFQNAANNYSPNSLKLPSLISPPISTTPRVFCNNPNLVSPVSSGFDNMINNNNPTTTQPSLLHLLHCNSQDMINAKLDDACSFFWDANLEDGVLSNIEEMKFDGDSTMMMFQ